MCVRENEEESFRLRSPNENKELSEVCKNSNVGQTHTQESR